MEAVSIEVGAASSLGQELLDNLDQPLRALHQGFKGFFSDMLSGSISVAGAFKRFAATIIDSIFEMAAAAAANQIFSLLANVIGSAAGASFGGGSFGGGGSSAGVSGTYNPSVTRGFMPITTRWGGGLIPDMYGGGSVARGLTTRDSTLVHAAKGEYMLRRSAVNSIGTDVLDAMNSRGAEAIRGMGRVAVPAVQPAPVQTNVYVVAPEEKPQLGPNDVIAIIANDVLKGGATKKLIKQVSNG